MTESFPCIGEQCLDLDLDHDLGLAFLLKPHLYAARIWRRYRGYMSGIPGPHVPLQAYRPYAARGASRFPPLPWRKTPCPYRGSGKQRLAPRAA